MKLAIALLVLTVTVSAEPLTQDKSRWTTFQGWREFTAQERINHERILERVDAGETSGIEGICTQSGVEPAFADFGNMNTPLAIAAAATALGVVPFVIARGGHQSAPPAVTPTPQPPGEEPTPTPEPATFVLMFFGLAAIIYSARRDQHDA